MKFYLLILLQLLAFFLAPTVLAENNDVFPKTAAKLKPIELGTLILLLMPNQNEQQVEWDVESENPSLGWVTAGVKKIQKSSLLEREALARIRINGTLSHILRERKKEAAWIVNMKSEMPLRFGPDEISIYRYECSSWCEFISPIDSLRLAGITATEVCKVHNLGEDKVVWRLSHPAKRMTILTSETYGGNAVQEARLHLIFRPDSDNLCVGDSSSIPFPPYQGTSPASRKLVPPTAVNGEFKTAGRAEERQLPKADTASSVNAKVRTSDQLSLSELKGDSIRDLYAQVEESQKKD